MFEDELQTMLLQILQSFFQTELQHFIAILCVYAKNEFGFAFAANSDAKILCQMHQLHPAS
jgi:hypothetical protein